MAQIGPRLSFQSVGPAGVPDVGESSLFAVIQSPRGPDGVVVPCSSLAQFKQIFGGLDKLATVASGTTADTYTVESDDDVVQAYYSISNYFAEKGQNSPGVAYIVRTVATSSGPTAASKTFVDGPQSGAHNTTITAKSKGRDGATTQIYVINPSPKRGVFTLGSGTVAVSSGAATVTASTAAFTTGSTWNGYGIKIGTNYYTIASVTGASTLVLDENAVATETAAVWSYGNSTTAAQIVAYHPRSGIREEFDLEPTAASAADISRRSQLISVSLPAGLQLPKTTAGGSSGASKLNSGSAATADSYAATAADYVGTTSAANVKTGLQCFNDIKYGTGFVCVPGQTSATVDTAIKSHCETYYRFGLYTPSETLTLATAQTEFANVSSNVGAGWVPRIWVPDSEQVAGGNSILVDNVGAIAGLWARMHRDFLGPSKSPSGLEHTFANVVDVERQSTGMEIYDDSAAETLADVFVNTIRNPGGTGVYSWGNRTFASNERWRQCQGALIACIIYHRLFRAMKKLTFEPIDPFGRFFARAEADANAIMFDLWKRGALYGTQPGKTPKQDNAWFVVCNKGNNPDIRIGNGQVRLDASFVTTPEAEAIEIPLQFAAPGFGAAAATAP